MAAAVCQSINCSQTGSFVPVTVCVKLSNRSDENFCDENRLEMISCHYAILRTESFKSQLMSLKNMKKTHTKNQKKTAKRVQLPLVSLPLKH